MAHFAQKPNMLPDHLQGFTRSELSSRAGIERLLDSAWDKRAADPAESEALARSVLDLLDEEWAREMDPRTREDLRARAWIYVANSRRIRGDLTAAQEMLRRAEGHLRAGTHSPLCRAELLLIEAVVARAYKQFSEAEDKLDQVVAIQRWSGDDKKVGLALMTKANLLFFAGKTEESIECLESAEEFLNFAEDPRMHLSFLHFRTMYLSEVGRTNEAQELLPEVRTLAEQVGSSLDSLRVQWMEGLIALNSGSYDEAEKILRHVRQEFLRAGIDNDAAQVTLDLAVVLLEAGHLAETRELAEEILPMFQSLDIHREAFAALILFHRAALEEQATAGMARDIAAFLKRTGTTPALRYEEPS